MLHDNARILVVEDDRDIADALERTFRKEGFDVAVALDGAKGLDLARSMRPRLVVLDLMLPEISGLEVLGAIRQDPEIGGMAVILLTACSEALDRIRGFEMGPTTT